MSKSCIRNSGERELNVGTLREHWCAWKLTVAYGMCLYHLLRRVSIGSCRASVPGCLVIVPHHITRQGVLDPSWMVARMSAKYPAGQKRPTSDIPPRPGRADGGRTQLARRRESRSLTLILRSWRLRRPICGTCARSGRRHSVPKRGEPADFWLLAFCCQIPHQLVLSFLPRCPVRRNAM